MEGVYLKQVLEYQLAIYLAENDLDEFGAKLSFDFKYQLDTHLVFQLNEEIQIYFTESRVYTSLKDNTCGYARFILLFNEFSDEKTEASTLKKFYKCMTGDYMRGFFSVVNAIKSCHLI